MLSIDKLLQQFPTEDSVRTFFESIVWHRGRSMSREMSLFYATFCLSLTSFFSGFPGLRYTV